MKLTKFEQSGFILEANDGFRLAIDIGSLTPVEKLDGVIFGVAAALDMADAVGMTDGTGGSIDAMLVSHIHGDHFSIEQIKKLSPKKLYINAECIEALGEEVLSSEIILIKANDMLDIHESIKVQIFDVDHGPNLTVKPKENFGFLIKADGQKIYFAGDMFYPSGIDVSVLEVDVALIPVGTVYTFGPQEAFDFIKQFKSTGRVTPMHYERNPLMREEFVKLAVGEGFNTDSFIL